MPMISVEIMKTIDEKKKKCKKQQKKSKQGQKGATETETIVKG